MAIWKWTGALDGVWNSSTNWAEQPSNAPGIPAPGDTVIVDGDGPNVISSDTLTSIIAVVNAGTVTDPQLDFVAADAPASFQIVQADTAVAAIVGFNENSTYGGTLTTAVNTGQLTVKIGAANPDTLTLASTGNFVAANGATLTIEPFGTVTDVPTFENDGTVLADAGAITIGNSVAVTGTGTYTVLRGGTVSFGDETVASSVIVNFADDNGTLLLDDPADFAGQITNFAPGDRIVFGTAEFADGVSYDAATDTLTATYEGTTVATLSVTTTASPVFSVRFTDDRESVILGSQVTRTWNGGIGDYFNAAQWTSSDGSVSAPLGGDTAVIGNGLAVITADDIETHGILDWQTIDLGSLTKGVPATLAVTSATFGGDLEIDTVNGTGDGTASFAAVDAYGSTTFNGRLYAIGAFSRLDLSVGPLGSNPGEMTFTPNADVEVSEESRLALDGGYFNNEAAFTVTGNFDIEGGATLGGYGQIQLNGDARLLVDGTVDSGQQIVFNGDTGRIVIDDVGNFGGFISSFVQGNEIQLPDVTATSVSYDKDTHELILLNDGTAVPGGTIEVADWLGNGSLDFTLTPRADGGVTIGYVPGPFQLNHQQLPVVVAAAPGSTVNLATILQTGFGASADAFSSFAVYNTDATILANNSFRYWTPPATNSVASWLVNGSTVAPGFPSPKVLPDFNPISDETNATLTPGSNIANYQGVELPVATNADGSITAVNDYSLVIVDPNVISPTAYSGTVNPSDIVSSAIRFADYYTDCSADNDCGFIADAVAAAAGAVLPWDVSTDPSNNVSGGFWRIVYNGSGPDPISNWFTLTQPGDVVRMGHVDAGQHTTTIVGTLNPDGSIPVYDNVDTQPDGQTLIGIHNATYDTHTEPDTVTIYRLDPRHQYLINGTTQGELIVGSPWNNLIRPGPNADTIVAGSGTNEIQGMAVDLNGDTLSDFHPGDYINVSDLIAATTTVGYNALSGSLDILSSGTDAATLTLPTALPDLFSVTTDTDDGGVRIDLACFAAGTRIATADGDRAVETLREGDLIRTASGALRPLRWLAWRSIDIATHPDPAKVMPVRIAAHSLGPSQPRRALFLSPDHAVFAEDVLIPVKYLRDDNRIKQVRTKRITYYHLELDRHDVILAENLPVESYLETGGRAAFENNGGPIRLHASFAPPDSFKAACIWEAQGCAPLVIWGPKLDHVRARIAAASRRKAPKRRRAA